jgi:hypothetical protein
VCPSLPPQGLMNGVDEVAVKCIKAETPSGDHSAAATPQHSTQSVAVQHHLVLTAGTRACMHLELRI